MTLGLNFSKSHFLFLQNGNWNSGLPNGRKMTLGPLPCPSYIHISKPTLGAKQIRWPDRQIPTLLIPKYLKPASHIQHKSDKTGQLILLKGKASLTARDCKRHTARLQPTGLERAQGHTSPYLQLQTTKTEPEFASPKSP